MTSTTTVFARRTDAGHFAILDNDSGRPATSLDADVYPVGSEFGARYEHARGIVLTREDVIAAGIDFETPSDADEPEAATEDSAPTTFFVAIPANDHGAGMFGIGHTEEAAVQDVSDRSGWRAPTVRKDDDGHWVVTTDTGEDPAHFPEHEEAEARDYAAQHGFVAVPCTERLHAYIEAHEVPSRWTTNAAGQRDLDISEEDLAAALAEVDAGIEGADARALVTLMTGDALADARDYVDAYVWQDEDSDIESVVEDDHEFRFALELAVRDRLLGLIAEREAA